MRTTVHWGHMMHGRHVAWRVSQVRAPAVADDMTESVRWAWGLMAMTLPAGLVAVLVVDSLAAATDLSATGVWAGVVVYAAVLAPLVASMVIGIRAWRGAGEHLALRAALVSAAVAVIGTTLLLGTWLG